MSIRLKVILPYLLLTVIVAAIGVYVVTRLVAKNMSDRLTNQLIEAGRVVSDSFIRLESEQVQLGGTIIYTEGLSQAVLDGDKETALRLASAQFVTQGNTQSLFIIGPDGDELVHIYLDSDYKIISIDRTTGAINLPIVTPYLNNRDVEEPPHRALGLDLINNETYYYTSMPIRQVDENTGREEFAGVIVLGTPIRSFQTFLKQNALADVIIYRNDGAVIATTLVGPEYTTTLESLSITQDEFQNSIQAEDAVLGENITLFGRNYRLARGPLQVGNDLLGVYAVVLSSDFVLQSGEDSRSTYVQLFSIVFFLVVIIGFLISRMITKPLYTLVDTSHAIAGGDLSQRTHIASKDELGELAVSFDNMTNRLEERTLELQEANAKLKRIDQSKTKFIQISAHELRTPLTLILGYSQMLAQDLKSNPELTSFADGILEGAERMNEVVDSMLDASRIDNNALVLKKSTLELEKVIDSINKTYADALEERHIKFKKDGLDKLPPVTVDPDLIRKMFNNLVVNAIKFTPDGGTIEISGKYLNGNTPPQVEVTVADTGIGIDPSAAQSIFEKFNQVGDVMLHSSGKTKFKGGGPGLGLAIARGIVQAHGGKISMESSGYDEEKLPGSKFIVVLPMDHTEGTIS